MNPLLYALGVVLAIIAILISLGLHEFGHLVPAKVFGAKVTQYFFGFGPTIWSRQKGETEYGLKPVPLGAFVKIIGVVPPGRQAGKADEETNDERHVTSSSTGMFTQLIEDARSAEWEEITPEDEPRLFYKLAWWKKAIVYVGGVSMNLILAVVFFALALMGIGLQEPTTTIGSVVKCVEAYQPQAQPLDCKPGDPLSPAAKAGLRPGDKITSYDGQKIHSYDQLTTLIRDGGDRSVVIGIVRDGKRMKLTATPVVDIRPDLNDPTKTVQAGFLGVSPTIAFVPQSAGYVVRGLGSTTWESIKAVGALPVKLYHLARAVVGVEKRSNESPVGLVGIGRLAGELTSEPAFDTKVKISSLLLLVGGFNLFLGIINLVPLPPFDGGSLFGYLYEGLRRGIDRLRGRKPQDRFFDVAKLLPLTYVMVLFILVIFIITNVADVVVPLKAPGS